MHANLKLENNMSWSWLTFFALFKNHDICSWTSLIASPSYSLISQGEEKDRLVYTVCAWLNHHGIPWQPCLYVYWWRHKLAALMCQLAFCWVWVLYHTVLCLLDAGYLEIKLKKEQVASNECRLPRKHTFMQLSTNFGKWIPTTTYQTFLFVPCSIN